MELKMQDGPTGGMVYVGDEKEPQAQMTYSRAGEKMIIIDHTEVGDALRGQGVGKKMVYHMVDFAREHNIKIIPLCPYAKSVFDKEAEIRDVLRG